MSFTELHTGKIWKASNNPEKFAEWYFKVNNLTLNKRFYDTPLEQLLNEHSNEYIMLKESLYRIKDIDLGESEYN